MQRQKEQEALTAALTRGMPLMWSAVASLMDAERVQRLQRLVASWERQSFLPQLSLTVPRAASPPPAVAPTPQPIAPAAAPKPAPAVVPAPTPVPHPGLPGPHYQPHAHHPHVAPHHGSDEEGAEPFSGAGGSGVWNAQYVATVDSDLEFGDKILLPPSALGELTLRSVRFPILLQLRNPANNKRTYAGVREFSAPEGRCVVPRWVLQNVEGTETRRLHIRTVDLPQVRQHLLDVHTFVFVCLCVCASVCLFVRVSCVCLCLHQCWPLTGPRSGPMRASVRLAVTLHESQNPRRS